MNAEYLRGRNDAPRFDLVRQMNGGWEAIRGAAVSHLIQPVTVSYLDGLEAGGCPVMRRVERRVNKLDALFNAIASVMGAA